MSDLERSVALCSLVLLALHGMHCMALHVAELCSVNLRHSHCTWDGILICYR